MAKGAAGQLCFAVGTLLLTSFLAGGCEQCKRYVNCVIWLRTRRIAEKARITMTRQTRARHAVLPSISMCTDVHIFGTFGTLPTQWFINTCHRLPGLKRTPYTLAADCRHLQCSWCSCTGRALQHPSCKPSHPSSTRRCSATPPPWRPKGPF